jgi:hypothetical protein
LLHDHQGALHERLGVGIAPLVIVERGQVVEARGGVRMVGAEDPLVERQGLLIGRLRAGVFAEQTEGMPERSIEMCRAQEGT